MELKKKLAEQQAHLKALENHMYVQHPSKGMPQRMPVILRIQY